VAQTKGNVSAKKTENEPILYLVQLVLERTAKNSNLEN